MTQMKNTFRRFRRGDLQAFWKDLRPEDLRELSVLNMTDPVMIEDLVTAMGQKLFVWVTERGPVAVFGVSPSGDPDVGHIWALASREAQRRWRFISRHAPYILDQARSRGTASCPTSRTPATPPRSLGFAASGSRSSPRTRTSEAAVCPSTHSSG